MTLRLSTSPHLRSPQSSTRLMLNVIIALLPSAAFGVYNYGYKALVLILVSMLSAVVSEYLWQRLTNRPVRIKDCSALVTGMILALCASFRISYIHSPYTILFINWLDCQNLCK